MEAEALAPAVVEPSTLPSHEAKVSTVVPAAAAVAVQKVFITARKQASAGEGGQRSYREATGCNRFVNSGKHSGGRA